MSIVANGKKAGPRQNAANSNGQNYPQKKRSEQNDNTKTKNVTKNVSAAKKHNTSKEINSMPYTQQNQKRSTSPTNVQRNSNIRSQMPTRRRSAKEAKKINPNSPEIKRVIKNKQGFTVKKNNSKFRRAFFAKVILFLLIFAVVFSMFCLVFRAVITSKDKSNYKNISVEIGLDSDTEIKAESVSYETYMRNGVFYVDMMEIADVFEFTTTGDHKELRFITNSSSGEHVRFEIGSSFASVNGTTVRLEAETCFEKSCFYVPKSFFDSYVDGMEITFDETEKELLILRKTERNSLGKIVESDIGFKLKAMDVTKSIDEYSLAQEIKDKTVFMNQSSDVPLSNDQ